MTAALSDTWALTVRDLLRLARQPWFVAIVLVQPVIWLLLFGALFQPSSTSPASPAATTRSTSCPACSS
jgi:ABC-2 type transport system permease protein